MTLQFCFSKIPAISINGMNTILNKTEVNRLLVEPLIFTDFVTSCIYWAKRSEYSLVKIAQL